MNAVLFVDEQTMQYLMDNRVVVPQTEQLYSIRVESDSDVPISIPVKISDEPEIIGEHGVSLDNFGITVLDEYKKFKEEFPNTTKWGAFQERRTLMSDAGNKGYDGYRELMYEAGMKPNEIMLALKYDVWSKKMESIKRGKNHLIYMKGFQAWINDKEYVKACYKNALKDEFFTEHEYESLKDNKTSTSMFDDL